jgi:cell pole-organizing protein PopZ
MNRPDQAGEPSMEEILASIRQIVRDEPSADKSASEIPANPLVPRAAASRNGSAASHAVPTPPTLDRLSGVLKNGPLPPTGPLGSKRPLPFDQDLADMLDEPASQDAAAMAPKPDIRVAPEFLFPSAKAADKGEPAPKAAGKPLNGASDLPPQLQPASPAEIPPLPFGSGVDTSMPPRNTSFPSLKTKGFFPSQPPAAPVRPLGMDIGPAPSAAAAIAALAAEPSVPQAFATPAAEASPRPLSTGSPLNGAGVFSGAPPQSPFESSRGFHSSATTPIEPTPVVVETVEPVREPHRFPGAGAHSTATDPSIAAAQALDALAQGLAASAAASGSTPPTPLRLADPAEQLLRSALTLQAHGAPARTLEDAVADMLRPMLQQWVADNMPRIIERALRTEVASSAKPGPKSNGF